MGKVILMEDYRKKKVSKKRARAIKSILKYADSLKWGEEKESSSEEEDPGSMDKTLEPFKFMGVPNDVLKTFEHAEKEIDRVCGIPEEFLRKDWKPKTSTEVEAQCRQRKLDETPRS